MGAERDELQSLGRFAEPGLAILISLASGPKHGYAMLEDIAGFSGVRVGAGTLYSALARLEERGLIAPLPSDDRRRPYRLTDGGRRVLGDQLAQLRAFVTTGYERLVTG
jgi:DNA-binding PadR family transcriptional regulator